MTGAQKKAILDEMKKTIGYIRDAEKNANAYTSADAIRNNMEPYFNGLAFTMRTLTDFDYGWSSGEDGKTWSLVIIDDSGERKFESI